MKEACPRPPPMNEAGRVVPWPQVGEQEGPPGDPATYFQYA